jgi:hypothetical protein
MTKPQYIVDRVDLVTDRLNDLRGRVQGRGVNPVGSAALAAEVNTAQEHWHDVRADLLANAGAKLELHPIDSSETLESWEKLVNGLIDKAKAENLATDSDKLEVIHTTTPSEAMAAAEHAIETGATAVDALIKAGLALGGVWLIAKLWPRGRR